MWFLFCGLSDKSHSAIAAITLKILCENKLPSGFESSEVSQGKLPKLQDDEGRREKTSATRINFAN
jgi:hypothetical protein